MKRYHLFPATLLAWLAVAQFGCDSGGPVAVPSGMSPGVVQPASTSPSIPPSLPRNIKSKRPAPGPQPIPEQ